MEGRSQNETHRNKNIEKERTKESEGVVITILLYAFLITGAIIMFFPFFWMLCTALKTISEINIRPPRLLPQRFLFYNFIDAWKTGPFNRYMLNSTFISTTGTISSIFLASMAGFAFAKYKFFGRDLLFLAILATMMIPAQATMIPLYVTVSRLGWVNTYQGVIVPGIASSFAVFLLRQFMQTIPSELVDAARIDGCSEFRIYYRIILPLAKPALAVLAIFIFMWKWNSFLWPLIVLDTQEMYTIQLGLSLFSTEFYVEYNYLMAASAVSILPILIVFLFFQKQFIEGIALTGLKG